MRGMMRLALLGVPGARGGGDNTAPTVEITSPSEFVVTEAFGIVITFSEPVVNFVAGDVTVANGTLSNFAGGDDVYTATITPTSPGLVTVDIAAGVCEDAAGNANDAAAQFVRSYALVIETFTQSLGAELLTNGDFSAWTGDDPDGWTVSGETGPEREVTQRGAGQLHADTPAGTGYANLYSLPTSTFPVISQEVLQNGKWFEGGLTLDIQAAPGGYVVTEFGSSANALIGPATPSDMLRIARARGTLFRILSSHAEHDHTITNVTVKRVTLNAQQVMPSSDAEIVSLFDLPDTPKALQEFGIFYRISDSDLETGYTCWHAYLRRNSANTNWDFRLDSVSAGTETNRVNVTGIGDAVGIKITCEGTKHNCWTTANGTDWVVRGAEVDISHNDTSTGINTIYSSAFTPTTLQVAALF